MKGLRLINAHSRSRLDLLLEELERAPDIAGMQIASERLRDHFRVDHLVHHWVSAAGDQYGCGTYDPAWVERYLEMEYLRVDPVIRGC